MSFSNDSSDSLDWRTTFRYSRCWRLKSVPSTNSVMPMTAFIGVRISWLMFARNALLALFACSLSRRAFSRSRRAPSSPSLKASVRLKAHRMMPLIPAQLRIRRSSGPISSGSATPQRSSTRKARHARQLSPAQAIPDRTPHRIRPMIGTAGSHHKAGEPVPPVTVAIPINTAKTEPAMSCPVSQTDFVNLRDIIEAKIAAATSATIPLARIDPSR